MKFIAAVLVVLVPLWAYAISCNCGSLASGSTIEYYTISSTDCCSGEVSTLAFEDLWMQQSNGTYEHVGTNEISGTEAQSRCCYQ